MTREERITYLARKLYSAGVDEKQAKTEREQFKSELFRLLDEEIGDKGHMLPVITVEVPGDFFTKTGMTKESFSKTRYPGWDVEHCEMNTATRTIVFVLKRNPHYTPKVVEFEDDNGKIRVSREVAEYEPQIDWETLKKERPDMYKKLAKRQMVVTLNESALEKLVDETPEDVATLQRHMRVKEPALKASARRVKEKDDG